MVLLGLLKEGPRHGYEIDQEIVSREYRQWARISKSTIYAALDRLTRQNCVAVTTQTVGSRPPRKVFSLTATGHTRLLDLIQKALSSSGPIHSDRLLGLIFASASADQRVRHNLFASLAIIEKDIAELDDERSQSSDPLTDILLEFRQAVLRAERHALYRGTRHLAR